MSPTIVLNEGVPLLAVGAAGGPMIISQTLLAIINFVDYDMPADAAIASPRFHHQWQPDELKMERAIGPAVAAELRMRGHTISEVDAFGACQAVGLHKGGAGFIGVPDPRGFGAAAGW
jgi:gamma-glutamyltranspeptidase/glutathione hydrolase